jgi:hypothetical protein
MCPTSNPHHSGDTSPTRKILEILLVRGLQNRGLQFLRSPGRPSDMTRPLGVTPRSGPRLPRSSATVTATAFADGNVALRLAESAREPRHFDEAGMFAWIRLSARADSGRPRRGYDALPPYLSRYGRRLGIDLSRGRPGGKNNR